MSDTAQFFEELRAQVPTLRGSEPQGLFEQIDQKKHLLDGVLDYSLGGASPSDALEVAYGLYPYWISRARFADGRRWTEAVLGIPAGKPPSQSRARATNAAGSLAFQQGETEAARRHFTEAASIARQAGDDDTSAHAAFGLARVEMRDGRMKEGRSRCDESLAIFRRIGDVRGIARLLNQIGEIERMQGDQKAARKLYAEALEAYRKVGDKLWMAIVLHNLGNVSRVLGETKTAGRELRDALAIVVEIKSNYLLPVMMIALGELSAASGVFETAAELLSSGEAMLSSQGATLDPADVPDFDAAVAAARARLGDARFNALRDTAKSWTDAEAVSRAMRLE